MHIEIYNQICICLDELESVNDELITRNVLKDDVCLKLEKLQQLAIVIGTQLENSEEQYTKVIHTLEQYCELIYSASIAVDNEDEFLGIIMKMKDIMLNNIMPIKKSIVSSEERYNIDILGSCVSRVIFLNGKLSEHGVENQYLKMNHFFDKNNIVLSMMPAPFSREEVESVKASELWDSSRIHSMIQCLDKSVVSLLLNGDSDYLILDFYDFQVSHAIFRNTGFSTCAFEFMNTSLYKKYKSEIITFNWKDVPTFLYYPYMDLFFEKISARYDSNHIILNRFKATSCYIDKKNSVQPLPNQFMQPYHANYNYNETVMKLENYIIDKYEPYVIDISKYFMGDEHLWENLNGAHFQKVFYEESFQIIRNIIFGHAKQKIYDKLTPSTVL